MLDSKLYLTTQKTYKIKPQNRKSSKLHVFANKQVYANNNKMHLRKSVKGRVEVYIKPTTQPHTHMPSTHNTNHTQHVHTTHTNKRTFILLYHLMSLTN